MAVPVFSLMSGEFTGKAVGKVDAEFRTEPWDIQPAITTRSHLQTVPMEDYAEQV